MQGMTVEDAELRALAEAGDVILKGEAVLQLLERIYPRYEKLQNIDECVSDCFGILPDGEPCHFHRKETCKEGVSALEVLRWLATERNPNIYTAISKAQEVMKSIFEREKETRI